MRITFLAAPLDMSGGARVVLIYARELAKMGHQVTIVTPTLDRVPIRRKMKSFLKGNGWPRKVIHPPVVGARHIGLECDRPITEHDVPDADVLISTWWETAEWAATFPASKGRKFHFIQHHEVFPHLPDRTRAVYRLPMKRIVIAKWLQDLMASEYGDTNVSLVPNSVDRDEFFAPERPKNQAPTVGLLYSSVGFKGLDTSLRALQIVEEELSLQVLAFGSETLKRDLPLPKASRYFMRPQRDKIRGIYSSCDVWLTCSRSEGFNLPALEAMACRTPVVSTRAGWPAEAVVDGVNGALVDVDDHQAAARQLLDILQLPDPQWRQLSEGAHRTAATSSWQHSSQLFEAALLE